MGVGVEVAARKLAIPFECPCCAGAPDAELRIHGGPRDGERSIAFPYCAECLAHVRQWESATTVLACVIAAGSVAGAIASNLIAIEIGLAVLVFMLPIAVVAAALRRKGARGRCKPTCIGPECAVEYGGWTGSAHKLTLASRAYAVKLASANAKHLADIAPTLRRLVESRLAKGTHEQISQVRGLRGWLAMLEQHQVPVARRHAVASALAELTDPYERQQLVLAATRIEVGAVLEKVEATSGVAAKRKLLQRAIQELRSDNIPDELQVEELRQLEERLRTLEQ
jgi:hypothetical protein